MPNVFKIFSHMLLHCSLLAISSLAAGLNSTVKSLNKHKSTFTKTATSFAASLIILLPTVSVTQAETLGQRAIYTVKILVGGDAAEVGQCSAFTFGDVSTVCGGSPPGPFVDNVVTTAPALSGGDGVADGLAGTFSIETGKANALGENTFSLNSFQMDPYLLTAGGTFKTTMTPPDGALNGSGTVNALGNVTLDVTGRTGVAQFFEGTIGIQPWNIDDSTAVAANGDPTTGLWETFTTGSSSNFNPAAPGGPLLTLTGRAIGDANTDGILDAVLVSVGNVGQSWVAFDGTPYSEAFNVQFELVSAKPVALPDALITPAATPLIIAVDSDLLANDLHADPAETISLFSFSQPTVVGGSIVDNGNDTLTYTPAPTLIDGDSDSFTYIITDVAGNTDTTTVTISLTTNNPPVCVDVNSSTLEDTPLTLDPTIGCTDAEGDALTASTGPVSVEGGAVVAAGGNDFTYTPPLNFFSPPDDSFGYTVTDGFSSVSANVIVTVNAVNDQLVCSDVANNTDIDTPLAIDIANDLLSTCTDPDGDTITFSMVQTPTDQGGNVSSDGVTLTYTPATGFSGTDTYTYTASDGTDTDTRTITTKVGIDFGNFTMLNVAGNVFGGTNDVVFTWDGSTNTDEVDYTNNLNFNMTIRSESSFPFNGFPWFAHTIRVFGPGTYSFDTGCTVAEIQTTGCPAGSAANSGAPLTMTVDPGQYGVHILFDWSDSTNIDVVNVWNQNDVWDTYGDAPPKNELWTGAAGPSPDPTTTWALVSTDDNGDGNNGVPMVDGPFQGYLANFNRSPGATAGPKEPFTGTAPDTKLGSGLFASPMNPWILFAVFMTMIGARRLRKT